MVNLKKNIINYKLIFERHKEKKNGIFGEKIRLDLIKVIKEQRSQYII